MDLKERLKQEASYMGKGAKIIGKKVAKTVSEKSKAWWQEQQELGRVEREAYKKARLVEARKRGTARAKKKQDSTFDFDGIAEVLLGSPDKDED